jgi:hypothetical protein
MTSLPFLDSIVVYSLRDPSERGVMAHFKCVACKVRLDSEAAPPASADLVGDLCPRCGSLLEPVGELAEIVGFQSIKSHDSSADVGALDTHQRSVYRVDDFFARRAALLADAGLDAGRWLDDGGSFDPEAVAEAMARPTPEEAGRRPVLPPSIRLET